LNAAKWGGVRLTLEHLPEIRSALKTDPEFGTNSLRLEDVIRRFCGERVSVLPIPELTLSRLAGHISSGGAAIVLAAPVSDRLRRQNHYFLVCGTEDGCFSTVNFNSARESLVDRATMRETLRACRGSKRWLPQGWLLEQSGIRVKAS
jgi:hypothetical protein